MSLVNQMLRDLENRRRDPAAGDSGAVRAVSGQRRRRRWMVAGLGFLLVGGGALAWWGVDRTDLEAGLIAERGESEASTDATSDAPDEAGAELDLMEPLIDYQPPPAPELPGLERAERVETAEGLRLRLDFEEAIEFRQQDGGSDRFVIELAAADFDLEDRDPPPGVDRWRTEDGGDEDALRLELVLDEGHAPGPALDGGDSYPHRIELVMHERLASPTTELAEAEPTADDEPAGERSESDQASTARESLAEEADGEGTVRDDSPDGEGPSSDAINEVIERTDAVLAEAGEMHRERRVTSPRERAEEAWAEARRELAAGNPGAARRSLEQVLGHYPGHTAARRALAELHAEAGQVDTADRILAEGLERGNPEGAVVRDRARLWLRQGDYAQAVSVLEAAWPELDDSIETRAQLAGALYRDEQPDRAVDHYTAVVETEPRRAEWWLGLGLAQEAREDFSAALAAYRQALEAEEGLGGSARDYVRERVRTLDNQ